MAGIVRLARTSTSGRRPAMDSRYPGMPYVNFSDRQFGVLSSTGQPLDFLAVRYHLDTASYEAGDFAIHEGHLYVAKAALNPKPFTASDWTRYYTQAEVDSWLSTKQNIGLYKQVVPLASARALIASDIGCLLHYMDIQNVTFTTPDSTTLASFPNGCRIDFIGSVGKMTFVAGGGITLVSAKSLTTVMAGGGASLTRLSMSTWQLAGALE